MYQPIYKRSICTIDVVENVVTDAVASHAAGVGDVDIDDNIVVAVADVTGNVDDDVAVIIVMLCCW